MPVAPFQYVNSHDHSHLIAFLTGNQQNPYDPLADRGRWYKIQPFIIAQYTASGIPMLWQGQEFSENYVLAADGDLRVHDHPVPIHRYIPRADRRRRPPGTSGSERRDGRPDDGHRPSQLWLCVHPTS